MSSRRPRLNKHYFPKTKSATTQNTDASEEFVHTKNDTMLLLAKHISSSCPPPHLSPYLPPQPPRHPPAPTKPRPGRQPSLPPDAPPPLVRPPLKAATFSLLSGLVYRPPLPASFPLPASNFASSRVKQSSIGSKETPKRVHSPSLRAF